MKNELQVREIKFEGKGIVTALIDEKVYVSIKSICDNLGMSNDQYKAQKLKARNDELLKVGIKLYPVDTGFGIKETMMPNLFQIYPNPSNGKLQIGSDRNDLEIASIELYNVQGDKVKMISCEAHTRSLNLDLIELANGVYQVVIITPDNTRHNNKLVLNR